MATFRSELDEAPHGVVSMSARVFVVVAGLMIGVAGLVAWSIEAGVGTTFTEERDLMTDEAVVYAVDQDAETKVEVFRGTRAEADEYVENARGDGRNLLVPGVVIVAGAVLVLIGLWSSGHGQRESSSSTATTTV